MDGIQFDALIGSWGTRPRRSALRSLAGGVLSIVFGGEAMAACLPLGQKCGKKKGRKCCGLLTCKGRTCMCAGRGRTFCGGECVDLFSNAGNCGACGTDCGEGNVCSHGNCCNSPNSGCGCSPSGFACERKTCCRNGGSTCLPSGVCP